MEFSTFVNRFWQLNSEQPMPTSCAALYFYLLNKSAQSRWEPFELSTVQASEETGMVRQTILKARSILADRGLIEYLDGKGRMPPFYRIVGTESKSLLEESEIRPSSPEPTPKEENLDVKKIDAKILDVKKINAQTGLDVKKLDVKKLDVKKIDIKNSLDVKKINAQTENGADFDPDSSLINILFKHQDHHHKKNAREKFQEIEDRLKSTPISQEAVMKKYHLTAEQYAQKVDEFMTAIKCSMKCDIDNPIPYFDGYLRNNNSKAPPDGDRRSAPEPDGERRRQDIADYVARNIGADSADKGTDLPF